MPCAHQRKNLFLSIELDIIIIIFSVLFLVKRDKQTDSRHQLSHTHASQIVWIMNGIRSEVINITMAITINNSHQMTTNASAYTHKMIINKILRGRTTQPGIKTTPYRCIRLRCCLRSVCMFANATSAGLNSILSLLNEMTNDMQAVSPNKNDVWVSRAKRIRCLHVNKICPRQL